MYTRFLILALALAALAPAQAQARAKFEPATGCYLGAFIEHDQIAKGNAALFEAVVGRPHAMYMTYSGYGRPFPLEWAEKVRAAGAVVHLGWEPNEGLAVIKDDAYLRGWARAARDFGAPIFLRFASEMNGNWMPYSGNPALYKEKWRLIHGVLAEEAPNVAMVWCPFATPQRTIPWYYPGDEYVDWVGVNIYSVVYHNNDPGQPAAHEDPRDFLRHVYDMYADRKPIMICEYAATTWCSVVNGPSVSFAVDRMTLLYRSLATEFPRVKGVCWFSWDTVDAGAAHNNYSLTSHPQVSQRYRELTMGEHFLERVVADPLPRQPAPPAAAPAPGGATLDSAAAPRPAGAGPEGVAGEPALPAPRPVEARPAAPPTPPVPQPKLGIDGLADGQVVDGVVRLSAYHPADWKVRYVAYRVDGKSVLATNQPPYRLDWDTRELEPGRYTVQIRVMLDDAEPALSDPLTVEVRSAP